MGISGACRCDEIVRTTVSNTEQHGKMFDVKIPTSKNQLHRCFSVHSVFYQYMKPYMDIRIKKNFPSDRLLLSFCKDKCKNQVCNIFVFIFIKFS